MSITSSEILARVNKRLIENFEIADIDFEVIQALVDLSLENDYLEKVSADATLDSGDNEISIPTDMKRLISIQLDDGNPLTKMDTAEYASLVNAGISSGTPTKYYASYDVTAGQKYYLNRNAPEDMTYNIRYYYVHPESYGTIAFPDEFAHAIYNLVTSYVAYERNLQEQGQLWEGRYYKAKELLDVRALTQPGYIQPNDTYGV